MTREVEPYDFVSHVRVQDVIDVPTGSGKDGVRTVELLHMLHHGGLAGDALLGPQPKDATMYNGAVDNGVQLSLPWHPHGDVALLREGDPRHSLTAVLVTEGSILRHGDGVRLRELVVRCGTLAGGLEMFQIGGPPA